MAFSISPSVSVTEFDNTNSIGVSGTSIGGYVGQFTWGPSNIPIRVDSENQLVEIFGAPTPNNYTSFFPAANYLAYTNNLLVVRSTPKTAFCADANSSPVGLNVLNEHEWEVNYHNNTAALNTLGNFCARYPGTLGNSLKISICSDSRSFKSPTFKANTVAGSNTVVVSPKAATFTGGTFANTYNFSVNDTINIKQTNNVYVPYTIASVSGNTIILSTNASANGSNLDAQAQWAYADLFPKAPGTSIYAANQNSSNDELSIVVIDQNGAFTGVKGTVLETYDRLSKAIDAITDDGQPNFYDNVIFNKSKYIYVAKPISSDWKVLTLNTQFTSSNNYTVQLTGGTDVTATDSTLVSSFGIFLDPQSYTIDFLITGEVSSTVINSVIAIAESRKDCVAFISPPRAYSLDTYGASVSVDYIVNWKNSLAPSSTSYAICDSGYKYQFDKYNSVYRYVALNGDIAGLCAKTDKSKGQWWSPAGFNRGQILNAIKLGWNPTQTERDILYDASINPVVSFPGQGIILFGDKTMQTKRSAFDRINVRRLFITLERSIADAAKYSLFEFNDSFTRSAFVSMVEPYLRQIQAARGIYAFKVVCDESNNPPNIIDQNGFVGDIYVQPARSINFIQLNFTAVNSGVTFTEITGK